MKVGFWTSMIVSLFLVMAGTPVAVAEITLDHPNSDFRIAAIVSSSLSDLYGTAVLVHVDVNLRELTYVTNEHIVRGHCRSTKPPRILFQSLVLNYDFVLTCKPIQFDQALVTNQSFENDLALVRVAAPVEVTMDQVKAIANRLNSVNQLFVPLVTKKYKIIGVQQLKLGTYPPVEHLDIPILNLGDYATQNCPPLNLGSCYKIPVASWGFSGSPMFEVSSDGRPDLITGLVAYYDPLQPITYIIPWQFVQSWIQSLPNSSGSNTLFALSKNRYEVSVLKGPLAGTTISQESPNSMVGGGESQGGGGESQGGGSESQGGGGDNARGVIWSSFGGKHSLEFDDVTMAHVDSGVMSPDQWGLEKNNFMSKVLFDHPALRGLMGIFSFVPGVKLSESATHVEQWDGHHVYDLKQFMNLYQQNQSYSGSVRKSVSSIFPKSPHQKKWWYSVSIPIRRVLNGSSGRADVTADETETDITDVLNVDVSRTGASIIQVMTVSGKADLVLETPMKEDRGFENFTFSGSLMMKTLSSSIRCPARAFLRSDDEGVHWSFKLFYACPVDISGSTRYRINTLSIQI